MKDPRIPKQRRNNHGIDKPQTRQERAMFQFIDAAEAIIYLLESGRTLNPVTTARTLNTFIQDARLAELETLANEFIEIGLKRRRNYTIHDWYYYDGPVLMVTHQPRKERVCKACYYRQICTWGYWHPVFKYLATPVST